MQEKDLELVRDAMYRKDLDALWKLAGCICCCEDHYFLNCPAQTVGTCYGQQLSINPLIKVKYDP